MTTVSLAMPSHGQAAHIYDAVSSILLQDFDEPYELVIVFGGAEPAAVDEAVRAVRDHANTPCRTRIMRTRWNTGPGDAINRGFETFGKSPFWGWVSSDNVLAEDCLTWLVDYLRERPGVDAAFSSYYLEEGRIVNGKWQRDRQDIVRQEHVGLEKSPNCYIGPAHLHRRELWERVGPHREYHAHDYDWWLRAEEQGRIEHVDEILAVLRRHPDRLNVRWQRDGWHDAERIRQEALRRRGLLCAGS